MANIKVLLADNHVLVREGLQCLLANEPDIEVIDQAGNWSETIDRVKTKKPDVAVFDISMPGVTGLDAIRQIRAVSKKTQVVILTMHQKRAHIRETLHAGVTGYLLKTSPLAEVVAAIRAARDGKYYLSSEINTDIINIYLRKEDQEPLVNRYDQLTKREQQVFRMIAEGNTTTEIAELLSISPKTVAKHRTNLMEKLDMKNTASMVYYAIKIGVAVPDENLSN